jgi:sugar phosphate isomerase/epimerase
MTADPSRRDWLAGAAAGAALTASGGLNPRLAAAGDAPAAEPFGYCFNTSTVRGQKLKLVQEVETASRAGYQGIEPWVSEIDQYAKEGGSLADLRKRIADAGLSVEDAIGFVEWAVDDDARRQKALEEAKRVMGMVREVGGKRLAAPPSGATNQPDLNLLRVAERYRALAELGDSLDVIPVVEHWGHSKALSRLGEAAQVAIQSGHPKACVLPDVFHLYKGGSGFGGIHLLRGAAIGIIHVNDYPADPPRDKITDAQRVYPGDGVAPLKEFFRDLRAIGYRGMLSLELFNRDYWRQDALAIAKTGLEKLRAAVRAALA